MSFSLKILFPVSRSKNYRKAVKLAKEFNYTFDKNLNEVEITNKLLNEKWDLFNRMFWLVLDWKGNCVEYKDRKYYSHADKTKIFYSLQQKHLNHICAVMDDIAIKRFEMNPGDNIKEHRTFLN